jgi:ribonuclease Z
MNEKEKHKKEVEVSQNSTPNKSRRSFLKGSIAAAGAGIAVSSMSGSASAQSHPKGKGKVKGKTMLNDVIARPDLWFYPGEKLDANEMRVTLMGTGWGNIIRHNQKGASIYVELGNGESFVFDVGPGCGINYNTMQVPASRMTKIFLTHLHMDHTSDLAWMYAFGPAGDRYTPFRVWGPTGTEPKYGTKANIEGIKTMTQWHRPSFETCLDVGDSYKLDITELDYRKNTGIAYQENGVTIRHWPALHIMDGAISYRLDWNGLSVVWTGDTQPNHFTAENAKGVDVLIHETAPTAQRYSEATGLPLEAAKIVVKNSHTPAKALGKVLQLANPRLGVTSHCPVDPQEMQSFYDGVRSHWDGQYQVGEDLMVFNISSDKILIRKGGIHERPWQPNVLKPKSTTPTLEVKDYQTGIFDKVIKDY